MDSKSFCCRGVWLHAYIYVTLNKSAGFIGVQARLGFTRGRMGFFLLAILNHLSPPHFCPFRVNAVDFYSKSEMMAASSQHCMKWSIYEAEFSLWNWDLWARWYCLKWKPTGTEGEKQRQTVKWHPLTTCITIPSLSGLNFDLWKYLPQVNFSRKTGFCISQFPSTRYQRPIYPWVGILLIINNQESTRR